jgi:hypothetical protein
MQTSNQNLYEASEQWRNRPADERFETLDALRQSVQARRLRSRSVDLETNRINITESDNRLVVNSSITACEPTHWSFGQLAVNIGAPASYLRSLPRPLVQQCFEHGLKNANRETVKFMTVARDEGPNILQAVTSATYGRIWDADVVDAVQRVVDRTGNRFNNPKDWTGKRSGLYASDHDVFVFMVDGGSIVDAGPRAQINRGFIAWNSETGAKTFGLMTFLFNYVCGNHIIWGASEVNKLLIRHTSGGPYRFDSQAGPMLKAYVDASAQPVADTIKRAQDYLLPAGKDDELLNWTAKHGKFSRSEVREAVNFAKAEEGDCRTLWQLVQGFTAYARGFDFIDSRVDLEKRAGALLNVTAS